MSASIILIINYALVAFGFVTVASAFRKLRRGTAKPLRTGLEAIITVLFFGLVITLWNTGIPVVFWWFLVAGISLLAGVTVISAAKVRKVERR